MSMHVCVIGIDGSGKSTVVATLPSVLAAEAGVVAAGAGEEFRVCAPGEDHLAPGFHPEGQPLSARLSRVLKRAAKRLVDHRDLYPVVKVAQMLAQDVAAGRLGYRHRAAVVVSDGNALLCAAGRAANYLRRAASDAELKGSGREPEADDLASAFAYVLDGAPLPPESAERMPSLRVARALRRVGNMLGLRASLLPDAVVFLDLPPEMAAERIAARGAKVDQHENLEDLAQARAMYRKALEALRRYRPGYAVHVVPVEDLSPGEVLAEVVEKVLPALRCEVAGAASGGPLGTSGFGEKEVKGTALNPRYVLRYLLAKAHRGAWREPTFLFSRLGRLFLREGYSAGVMREIYDRDERRDGMLDRVFLEYSLHRAVYDRLGILERGIGAELERRLREDGNVRVFTAPSGFAYDLFRPLEEIARRSPKLMSRVHVTASDLDPHGELARELEKRAKALGVGFDFLREDLTQEDARSRFEERAPYDVVLFVGLSAWLPKPETVEHLRWVRKNLREGGVLVSDAFTPQAYALSGRYVGYSASYYEPEVYATLLDYCGFDGRGAKVESGRDGINHVLVARKRL